MYIVELPTCFPKYPNWIYVLIYIVLKYYCVLITNSYVLSIALYEFRQVVNVPGLPYENKPVLVVV